MDDREREIVRKFCDYDLPLELCELGRRLKVSALGERRAEEE